MSIPARADPGVSLTTFPLEVLQIILDKVYEESYTLTIRRPLHSILTTTSDLLISPLLVNHHIHTESLNAIRHNRSNKISIKLHVTHSDITTIPRSPSLTSFLSSISTLNLIDFPYDSSILNPWKQTCPNLSHVNIQHAYSTAANASLHRLLLMPNYSSLLHGNTDAHFATAATDRILHVHPTFCLDDLQDMDLTFPNIVDFWSPAWEREYYHENRILILSLTLTKDNAFVSQKHFKNRLRNIEYRPHEGDKELRRFPGVDYNVRFMRDGNEQSLDYDYRKDCFCSPYSPAGVL